MIQLSFMVFLVNQRTIYLPRVRSEKRYVPKTTTKSIWFLSFFLLKSSIGIDSQCFISSCHVWFVRSIVLYKSLLDSFFPSFLLSSTPSSCRVVLYCIVLPNILSNSLRSERSTQAQKKEVERARRNRNPKKKKK